MARAYSLDLRERILKDCDGGMSSEDAARKYSVSIAWVYSLRKQRRETGSIALKTYKPGPKMKLAPYKKKSDKPSPNTPTQRWSNWQRCCPHMFLSVIRRCVIF